MNIKHNIIHNNKRNIVEMFGMFEEVTEFQKWTEENEGEA